MDVKNILNKYPLDKDTRERITEKTPSKDTLILPIIYLVGFVLLAVIVLHALGKPIFTSPTQNFILFSFAFAVFIVIIYYKIKHG